MKNKLFNFILSSLALFSSCSSNNTDNENEAQSGLKTIHKSTFTHLSSDADQMAIVFDGEKKALIADDLWDNSRFFLVDLEENTVKTIKIPRQDLSLNNMKYANSDVLAFMHPRKNVQETIAYKIDANGNIKELQNYNLVSFYQGASTDISKFLAETNPQNLTKIQSDVCKIQPDKSYQSTQKSLVEYYYNDELVITVNSEDVKQQLSGRVSKNVTDDCAQRTRETTAIGYQVKTTRGVSLQSYESDLKQKIIGVEIIKDGKSQVFDFSKARSDYYFYLIPKGKRLYFIGDAVKYYELP